MLIGCSQFIWCFLMGLISKVGKVLAAQELTEGESNSICKLINSNVPFPVLCYIFLLPSHLWIFTWSIKIRNKIKAKCLKGIGFVCDRAYAWIFSLIMTLGGFMCLRLCLSFPPTCLVAELCVWVPPTLWLWGIWAVHCSHRASWAHGPTLRIIWPLPWTTQHSVTQISIPAGIQKPSNQQDSRWTPVGMRKSINWGQNCDPIYFGKCSP